MLSALSFFAYSLNSILIIFLDIPIRLLKQLLVLVEFVLRQRSSQRLADFPSAAFGGLPAFGADFCGQCLLYSNTHLQTSRGPYSGVCSSHSLSRVLTLQQSDLLSMAGNSHHISCKRYGGIFLARDTKQWAIWFHV